MKYRFSYIFLLFNLYLFQAQTVNLTGKVTDSISNTPLAYANIIADPEEDISIQFGITDDDGVYKLSLEKDKKYNITVSYLGYSPQSFSLSPTENKQKDFLLITSSEDLEQVTLTYTPPVIVKKDTITYRIDAFTTGEERKLRDVLKKLPAVEVDKAGNVTVQGKRVTKVLVENKEFFTGDSKLAVNNIPADAIDKIEVLDHYSEVSILKGLEDSNELAMNIKLKEDKKKFIFGDIEAGGGIKERYVINPSLYYYSPKTSVNLISDFNNVGSKSFTVKDYLEFEGGTSKLINDTKSYFSLLNDDFVQFLGNRDFISSKNKFGALNVTQSLSSKTDLSTYGIWSKTNNNTEVQSVNEYLANNNLIENRSNTGNQDSRFGIGKLELKLKPNHDTDLKFGSYIKASNNASTQNIRTSTIDNNNIINSNTTNKDISAKQNIGFHKRFNKKNTSSIVFDYHYQKSSPKTNWITDEEILQGLTPTVNVDEFNIIKNKSQESSDINLVFKHYYIINRFNHIYTTIGNQITFHDYNTSEFQILNNTINDFSTAGFGNKAKLNFNDLFLGLHYKFKKGKITFKPGVFYHNYLWNIKNNDNRVANNKKIIQPELIADVDFSSTKRLNLKYNLKARFPSITQLSNRFTLLDFNSVYQGNENLENEFYHLTQLRYFRFSLAKDIFYNFIASYRFKEDNFKNTTRIEGINVISNPLLSDFEDRAWNFQGSLKKGVGKYRFSIKGNLALADYEKPINNILVSNSSISYSLGGGLETRFKDFPNIELSYTKSISQYESFTSSLFETDIFSAYLEYDFLKDFIFKADYSFESYANKTLENSNDFDIANISLFYQNNDSPWGFELTANNIFDIKFKRRNSFSSILVTDERTFILPRIFLLKLSYKL